METILRFGRSPGASTDGGSFVGDGDTKQSR